MTAIVVLTAGIGVPSSSRLLGERLAEATASALSALGAEVEPVHIELRTLAVELAEHLTTRVPGPGLQAAFDAVCAADGVIAVTPVFNGSYSGLFKLFFDALDEKAMKGRPVLLGATGGSARHSLVIEHAMLPLFFYLKALVAANPVFATTKDWGADGGRLERRIARAAEGFAALVLATTAPRRGDDLEPLVNQMVD